MTVVTVLWGLQFAFVFALHDPEPIFDRLADCAAILWTLIFWMGLGVAVVWLVAPLVGGRRLVEWNTRGVKVALVATTALTFARWLFNLANVLGNVELVFPVLIVLVVSLSVWAWRRRFQSQSRQSETSLTLPSLDEGWSFYTLPILILSALSLAFTMGKHGAVLYANRAELRSAASTQSEEARRAPNVVIIVADGLRARSMSLYGYHRRTTPFLEQLAEHSAVYTQMYTTSTSTRPSLTSILSGKHPFSHGRLTKFLPAYDKPENLLRLLRQSGYTTAAVASNSDATFYLLGLRDELVHGDYPNFRRLTLSWLRDYGVYPTSPGNRMYDELAQVLPFLGFPERTLGYGTVDSTLHIAAQLVEKLPEPFFLFVHVHEPHDPYVAPSPFRNKYAKLDYDQVSKKIPAGFYSRYKSELQSFVDAHRDHYDEAIEFLDFELSKFIKRLKEHVPDPLLIITADHGESFERGFLNHGEDLYETSIHVPLIVQFPGQYSGYRSPAPVQSVDIAPTILRAAGISPPHWSDGIALHDGEVAVERDRIVLNHKDPDGRVTDDLPTKLAIVSMKKKLIVYCDVGRVELYDLAEDPGESKDVAKERSQTVKNLWQQLQRRLAQQRGDRKMACDFHPGV